MPRIVWSSPAVIFTVTAMVCGIMMGLAIAPRIDRLRHPDRKKAPRQRMPGTKEGKP